ncbi:MAG: ABC transporter permease, partial [Eubacteriales bacterium]
VMFEGLCIGALGIPIGILIGIPVIQGVLSLVRTNFANVLYSDVPLTLVLSLSVLAMSIILTLITILISAYIPAKKAAKTPIMTCIRQTNEGSVSTKAIKTSQRMTRILGMEGMLALKNFKRNRRRYRSIILSLTLSMVLFVASTSFGVYLNQIADNSSLVVEDYDICWVSDEMAETEMFRLYDSLKKVDGVTESHYQALTTFPCTLQMDRLPPSFEQKFGDAIGHDGKSETADVLVDVQYVDNKAYNMFLNELNLASGSFDEGQRMLITGFTSEGWYVQGEPIELIFGDGENSKKVMGTFVKDYPDLLPAKPGESHGYTLMVIAPYSQKTVFDALGLPVVSSKIGMTFKSNNPTQSSEKMQTVMNASGITDDYQLYNVYGILDQNRNLSFIISLFSTVFILMITLIAVANVFNTISTSIQLRRREFAMLRSIGMADKDFDKMMRFECAVYGARTMLWALPISIVLSLMIYFGMANGGGNVAYVFPWQSILISITGVVLIVFITMLYGVEKIKKENIIDALRDDIA